jgi:hypothetical protein
MAAPIKPCHVSGAFQLNISLKNNTIPFLMMGELAIDAK